MENHRHSEYFRQQLRKGWLKRKAKGLGSPWNKGLKGLHLSPATEFRLGQRHTAATIEKFRQRVGPKASGWKGGITPLQAIIRSSTEYKHWRMQVFERDDYTCQLCGVRGGSLQADHLKPFASFPALRFDVANGRTLCETCHRTTPTYGTGRLPVAVAA